jgi:hypothetical protein
MIRGLEHFVRFRFDFLSFLFFKILDTAGRNQRQEECHKLSVYATGSENALVASLLHGAGYEQRHSAG